MARTSQPVGSFSASCSYRGPRMEYPPTIAVCCSAQAGDPSLNRAQLRVNVEIVKRSDRAKGFLVLPKASYSNSSIDSFLSLSVTYWTGSPPLSQFSAPSGIPPSDRVSGS